MNDIKLIELLINKIKVNQTDESLYKDCFSLIVNYENIKEVLIYSNQLRVTCYKAIVNNPNISVSISDIASKLLLFEAPHLFDFYMLYLESGRRPAERFYLPRRKRLKPLVDALQELQDDTLDELFLSMPPRVGKTSILLFYVTWIIGKDSEHSNLYSAYSDTITKKFYDGILEILNDNYTYKWKEIFPKSKLVDTNSRDETLNIDRKKRYPSVTCRSLYGTLNGACDCNGTLISDDLIGGIEEALNPDRLAAAWSKVDNNLVTRAKQNAKILWCGTRWSMADPAGIRMGLLENDMIFKNRRYRIINVPAMNNKDESNFDYLYGVGFSTEYYKQRRASFERNNDMASWCAQYMGEPIERNGAFTEEAQKNALEQAKNTAIEQMTNETKDYISNNFGEVESWVQQTIESVLYDLKNK